MTTGTHPRIEHLDRIRSIQGVTVARRHSISLVIEPGYRLLDVGCGTGEDVLAMAELVGHRGMVTGVDSSEALIGEARRRAQGSRRPVRFEIAELDHLPFADASFDGARSDRLFQHLADPESTLAEMVRVVRSGAQVAVTDFDWGTLAIDTGDAAVTRRILEVQCTVTSPNGWMGRQLPRLFREAGLEDLKVIPHPILGTDPEAGRQLSALMAEMAQAQQVISDGEATAWLADLEQRGLDNVYFSAVLMITVAARKA